MISEFYKNLPKKRLGAGVLLFNEKNELLLLKPSYKDHWSIPGGGVDENESPRQACLREINEEIGLSLKNIQFISVDCIKTREDKNESLQFIFYGGRLAASQQADIKLKAGEISEFKFVRVEQALPWLSRGLQKRLKKSLKALNKKTSIYLEDGE